MKLSNSVVKFCSLLEFHLTHWSQQLTYCLSHWIYDIHSFLGQGLFSSTQTFLPFIPLTFCLQSLFYCVVWSLPQYQNYAHIELTMCFNVTHMVFIVCMIGCGRINLICKIHLLMDSYITATLMTFLLTHKVAIDVQVCFSRCRISRHQ